MADAVRRILTEPGLAASMRAEADRIARTCCGRRSPTATAGWPRGHPLLTPRWPAREPIRGRRVTSSGTELFAHLIRLTDDTGLFEHARSPNHRREHGYCTDDVARGLVVTSREPEPQRAARDGWPTAT